MFPACIHDIKAAIRFLRKGRTAIAGSSSGGHLASLVGVSNKNSELEGRVGEYLEESS